MKSESPSDKIFGAQQNRFRGLVSNYKSKAFSNKITSRPSQQFRSGLRELLLEARAVLHPSQFKSFLCWINHQVKLQLAELTFQPIGFEELAGIFTEAPIVSLEREILWISARIKAEHNKINAFRKEAKEVEQLVLQGKLERAIELLKALEQFLGVTLWSVQLRIALEQQAGGLERQKKYTADVRNVYKRGMLGFIAYHTSVRNEDRTTLVKYFEDIKSRINKHQYYTPPIKDYARYRLTGEFPLSANGIADILRVEQSHSIFDVYETFIAAIQEISRREDLIDAKNALCKPLLDIIEISDFRLTKVKLLLDIKTEGKPLSLRNRDISDALFSGDAKRAVYKSKLSLTGSGSSDPWQIIYTGFALAHSTRPRENDFRRPEQISKILGKILNGSCTSDNPLAQLEKLATNLRGLPIAVGLIDLIPLLRRPQPDEPWRPWLIGLNSPSYGLEDIQPNHLPLKFNSTLEGKSPIGKTEAMWSHFHKKSEEESSSNQVINLFMAARLLREGNYQAATEKLAVQCHLVEIGPLHAIKASLKLHAYYSQSERQRVIELIANEGSSSGVNRRLLPILVTLHHYPWADYKRISNPLAAPITLHLLWTADESDATASQLRYFTRNALREIGVDRPSKLCEISERFSKHQIIYFLKFVCAPNIIDLLRSLKSSREVKEERQAICALLRQLDPSNAEEYEYEMRAISNELALDEGQWIVDRSRIYVDHDALSRWAAREISEDYARYHDLLGLNIETKQNFDDVLKEIASSNSMQKTIFTPENEADAVLVSILKRVGEEFLNNPSFGFDFFLSKRIRHQSFVGLIRGPLEFAHLITTRESESGGYHRNDYWLEKFSCSGTETKELINEAFVKFATNFDDTLVSAKDKRFHIWSQEYPTGLLFLEISPQLIAIARLIVRMETQLPDFIATVISLLWAALEPSIANVRQFISFELKTKIAENFDQLRATIRKIAEQDPAFLELDMEIGGRSTEVQRALDDVATWFTHADIEALKRTFDLEQIVDIAIDSALKCLRTFEPNICRQTKGDVIMTASSLVFVHDVLFIALDNVRIHSNIKKPKVTVEVEATAESETLKITVRSEAKPQNRPAQEETLQEIRQLIDSGNFGRRTRREGRSGILKLGAAVNHFSKRKIQFGFNEKGEFELVVHSSMMMQDAD